MKQQTAVDQFLNAIKDQISLSQEHLEMIESYASQAKEMEKKQIIESGDSCSMKTILYRDELEKMTLDELIKHLVEDTTPTFGEQYYNETFKNK
jgi:hypothetical protein